PNARRRWAHVTASPRGECWSCVESPWSQHHPRRFHRPTHHGSIPIVVEPTGMYLVPATAGHGASSEEDLGHLARATPQQGRMPQPGQGPEGEAGCGTQGASGGERLTHSSSPWPCVGRGWYSPHHCVSATSGKYVPM